MSLLVVPAVFALLVWWLGTGVVLWLNHLPRRLHGRVMLGALVVGLGALYGLAHTAHALTPGGAFAAFGCAVLAWGVLEMSYYLGFVTGIHGEPCPERCSQARRFALALGASVYHELAVLGTAAVVWLLTVDAANPVGLHAFLVLWLMRWSAKLNLFLGVANFHHEWLPGHLRYLSSYIPRRPLNLLFPVSVSAASVLAALILAAALSPQATAFEQASGALIATLLALAVLEHWFMVLPMGDGALWRWALSRSATGTLLTAGSSES